MLVYVCSVATTGKLTRKFGKQCLHFAKGLIKVAAFNLDYGNRFSLADARKASKGAADPGSQAELLCRMLVDLNSQKHSACAALKAQKATPKAKPDGLRRYRSSH